MKHNLNTVFLNIRRLRKENKLTQQELADKVGPGKRAYICNLENGKRGEISVSRLLQFAEIFGCEPTEFFKPIK